MRGLLRYRLPWPMHRLLRRPSQRGRVRRELPGELQHDLPSPETVLAMIQRSGIRSAMVFDLQTPEAQKRIERALVEAAARLRRGDAVRVLFPALIASASKP